MKKIFLYLLLGGLVFTSCRKDETVETLPDLDVATQNSYDDQATQRYLEEHYLDEKGNLKAFDDDTKPDSIHIKLSQLNPVKLPSGVVYIMRANAQPSPGKNIGPTDSLKVMQKAVSYRATKTDEDGIAYRQSYDFVNTISGSGIPDTDPAYFYIAQRVLDNATTEQAKQRSYYEIEGYKEALTHFKAFEIPDSNDYNLQGVIIIPSRAAFGKDPHFNYTGISYRDRSFVFNFQVYNSFIRKTP